MATNRSSTKKPPSEALTKKSSTQVANREPSHDSLPVALTGSGISSTMQILKENLGSAGQLAISDLTKFVMPSGGGTAFEYPNPVAGHPKNVDYLDLVIVAFKDQKAFWKESIDDSGGGTPPDCRSMDMIHGIGSPGGFCNGGTDQQPEPCPFNEFGSAKEGEAEGKACKDLRFLFVLEGKSRIPKMIIVPPTSLKGVRRYFLDLAGQDISFYRVITRFTLVSDKNKKGIKYSRLVPEAIADLSDEEAAIAEEFKKMLDPMIGNMAQSIVARDTAEASA